MFLDSHSQDETQQYYYTTVYSVQGGMLIL